MCWPKKKINLPTVSPIKMSKQQEKKQKKNFGFYFKKFDYEILRPLFIHDYDRKQMQKEDENIDDSSLTDIMALGDEDKRRLLSKRITFN